MEPYVLPIHFGNLQGKHEINSNSLLTFVEAYKEIGEVFGLNTDIQIGVPEEGGWKTNLLFVISFVGLNPLVVLLTGETAEELAKKGHVYILEQINSFITTEANNSSDELPKECIKQKNKIYQQFQKDNCIDSLKWAISQQYLKLIFFCISKKYLMKNMNILGRPILQYTVQTGKENGLGVEKLKCLKIKKVLLILIKT